MSFIYDALKKAQHEGRIGDVKIPPTPKQAQQPKKPQAKPLKRNSARVHIPRQAIEDFSRLQEKIEFSELNGQCKVVSVTSSLAQEGASTVATWLAMMYAHNSNGHGNGYRGVGNGGAKSRADLRENILCIDGDIRNPSLHKVFGLQREMGLTEIIEDNLGFELAIKEANGGSLKVITAGRKTHNPMELIKSERLKHLMDFARERFRNIIIDVAPTLLHSDILAYSRVIDKTILVVRAGKTRVEVIQEAKAILEKNNINILGVVLNRREYEIPEAVYRRL